MAAVTICSDFGAQKIKSVTVSTVSPSREIQIKTTTRYHLTLIKISSVQLLSHVQLFATPWTATCQASVSITNSWSWLKLRSIKSVMPSNHLILCRSLLLASIFPSIRVFSNESFLHIRLTKNWSFSFSFSISPSNEYSRPISLKLTGWISLQSKGLSRVFSKKKKRVFSKTTVQKHQFFGTQLSL